MKVAIHQNKKMFNHSTSWRNAWVEFCQKENIGYEIVNCYDNDIIKKLKNFDCLFWHFGNYVWQDMIFARSILYSAKIMGLRVFPDFDTSWHFDDKIAETYLLQSINAPIPNSWIYFTLGDFLERFEYDLPLPVVAKLRNGSGSNNVKLIESKRQAVTYAKKMFSKGIKTSPSVFYKTKSNILSTRDLDTFTQRFKRIPDFIETKRAARLLPKEKGYVYFQEMIPNEGFDIRIVVVNNKLSFICRRNRKGDFRASGSGDKYFDRSLITNKIIDSAFQVSDTLHLQSIAYDYIIDKRTKTGKIIEMSYAFPSNSALPKAGGYWDRNYVWHETPLNAAEEVIKSMISKKP